MKPLWYNGLNWQWLTKLKLKFSTSIEKLAEFTAHTSLHPKSQGPYAQTRVSKKINIECILVPTNCANFSCFSSISLSNFNSFHPSLSCIFLNTPNFLFELILREGIGYDNFTKGVLLGNPVVVYMNFTVGRFWPVKTFWELRRFGAYRLRNTNVQGSWAASRSSIWNVCWHSLIRLLHFWNLNAKESFWHCRWHFEWKLQLVSEHRASNKCFSFCWGNVETHCSWETNCSRDLKRQIVKLKSLHFSIVSSCINSVQF